MYIIREMPAPSTPDRFITGLLALVASGGVILLFVTGLSVVPLPKRIERSEMVTIPAPEKIVPPQSVPEPQPSSGITRNLPLPLTDPVIEVQDEPGVQPEDGPVGEDIEIAPPVQEPFIAVSTARLVKSVEPVYPMAARLNDEEGVVQLSIQIDVNGSVLDARVARSSGFARLDESALRSVRSWRFAPAMRGNQAVVSWITIPIKFQLTRHN